MGESARVCQEGHKLSSCRGVHAASSMYVLYAQVCQKTGFIAACMLAIRHSLDPQEPGPGPGWPSLHLGDAESLPQACCQV